MKNKLFLLGAVVMAAAGVFANGVGMPAYPNFGMPRVEEMMFLVLQIGLIIFAAKLGGVIATWCKLPSILGELAMGILIGPWALGGIGFGDGIFKFGLFNGGALRVMNAAADGAATAMFGTTVGNHVMFDAASPALYGIATLASVILLFLSGLETDLKMFFKYSLVGLMVGVGGVVASFLFGDLCAVYLLPQFFPTKFGELATLPLSQAMMKAAPLYMGIMSTATSVGITARILSERKKMDSEEGVSIMAGAVIDDVLGLIVLAVGNGVIAAGIKASAAGGSASAAVNWGEIGMVAVKAFGVWLGATLVGVACARKISWLLKLFKNEKAIAVMAFGLALIVAGFFEYMGLAMIIGAYVMGLALSRTDLKHMIQDTLQPVYVFLVPIFFCVMGMMVDVHALMSREVLIFGGIYTALAVFAKIFGCALPSWCMGFNFIGGLRIGTGMVPRGEVALIIAGLGLSSGYLSQEIFGIGIMMTLITTVIAPPCLIALFTPKCSGKRHPDPKGGEMQPMVFNLPDNRLAETLLEKLVNEFKHEDYFAIRLDSDYDSSIWELSKDDAEVSVTRKGKDIRVECAPRESGYVMQAWKEVISEMNDQSRNICKLVQEWQQATGVNSGVAPETALSPTVRYVRSYLMLPSFRASSKHEAITKLVNAVLDAFPSNVVDREQTLADVFTREESMPTGLDHGIALPHGRTVGVKHIMGAIALVDNSGCETGAIPDYETYDHSKLEIIALTLVPEKSSGPYSQLLASIGHMLGSDENRKRLLACHTEGEMREFFVGIR